MRESSSAAASKLPDYLRDTYTWAYLDHRTVPFLDSPLVVSTILWGNASRLMNLAVAEFEPGQRVLQAAAVYGDFSQRLARRLGDAGQLTVLDVAPIQIANTRRKLASWPQASAHVADLPNRWARCSTPCAASSCSTKCRPTPAASSSATCSTQWSQAAGSSLWTTTSPAGGTPCDR